MYDKNTNRKASAKVIAVLNQKGGCSKTTTTTNLAASLGIHGKKVCIIDTDTQANATNAVGIDDEELELSLYDIMRDKRLVKNDVMKVICETSFEGVYLLPADIRLADLDIEIISMTMREMLLRKIVELITDEYDYIIIDCPPSLGLVTINALVAADSVIIPILLEAFSIKGIARLSTTIRKVKEMIHPNLSIEGILINQYEQNQTLSRKYEIQLKNAFGEKLFKTRIRKNVAVKKSQNPEDESGATPVYYYDKNANASVDYLKLAQEVIDNE